MSSSSAQPQRLLPRSVRHVVAISSGKGGVGKSTTAVNIATALANRLNLRVGLLDADVYGPSVPRLMNLSGLKPEVRAFAVPAAAGAAGPGAGAGAAARREGAGEPPTPPPSLLSRLWGGGRGDGAAASTSADAARGGEREVHKLMPLENHNVKCMSLGFLIADGAGAGSERAADRAVAWRGPMASSSLSRLVADTYWGDLDVLLVDMPPGTGDIHITYVHFAPLARAVPSPVRAPARDAGAAAERKVRELTIILPLGARRTRRTISAAQRLRLSGAVVVTTPQDVAIDDARRGAAMFRKVRTRWLHCRASL